MVHSIRHLPGSVGRAFALLLAAVLLGAGLSAVTLPTAEADEAPLPSPPPLLQRDENVVTSDPIPTVQIDDGYVWAQATIGTTVYAVGDFDNARSPLAAPGTQLTARSNVLAYDIETGALLPFAPQVNGVVKAVAASPDGSRIYIGGSFTSVDGQTRFSIAALDAATGAVSSTFKPSVGGTGVYALVAEGSTVYAGGLFTQGNGTPRKNLAAFNAANGALMPWSPETDLQVDAMVADPSGEKIVAGGRFSRVNGNPAMRGAAALDRSTGEVDDDWELVQTVKNGATNGKAGIFSLAADDSAVYGTGWVYAGVSIGNLEGTFAAEADSGEVRWIADCLGDHYGVYSTGETVYTTSHTHACSTMGLHPEQSPREHRYAEAYTADVRGTLGRNPHAGGTYQDWEGTPAPSAYAWYPDFYVGTTTGMGQAGLSITGVGDTISIAGEFQGVNQGRFEGIVRFSKNPPAGAKDGPRLSSTSWQPTANSVVPGRVRVSIPANWDRDDLSLTYELRRTGTSAPVATLTKDSTWWNRPTITLEDTTAPAGSSPSYTVVARDGDGNTRTSAPVSATVAAGEASAYTSAVLADSPQLYYPLGSTMQDWAGATPANAAGGVSAGTSGIANSATGNSVLSGTSSGRIVSDARVDVGAEFSTELWFRTTTGAGGKLIGYGDAASGSSGSYDRHLYMRDDGRLIFGVYPGEVRTVQSPDAYADGQWHHAVATLSASGQRLYVDGTLVASDPGTTSGQSYRGYWRIGGDNLSGWPNRPSSDYFGGAVDEVAVYDRALTPAQISAHYAVGAGFEAPEADFTVSTDESDVSVDAGASTAAGDASIVEYRWDFGDGSPIQTGETATHGYGATGTFEVTLTVVDSNGLIASKTREVSVLGPNQPPVAAFSVDTAGLTVAGDATASQDPDGSLGAFAWDWGDGSTSTGATSTHTYSEPGEYSVTLEVTDDRGATASQTQTVTVEHADPVARFSTIVAGLEVTADAGESTASDDATLEYSWDWGDGSGPTSGAVGMHTYAEDGVYEVTLTVTDSYGASDRTAQSLTVSAEALAASDTFSRTVSSGWGTADEGGTWTPIGGSASVGSVADGAGRLTLNPGNGRSMVLPSTSLSESGTEITYTLEGAPATGALYVGTESRYVSGSSYRTIVWHRADGTSWLLIQRNGAVIASKAGLLGSWSAGSEFHLRSEVSGEGDPAVRMKVWTVDSAEPTDWQLEVTDTEASALTAPGASAVYAYRAGSGSGSAPIIIDDYRLRDLSGPQPPAPHQPPVAAFTSSVSGRTVTVDGSESADADGPVVTYAWDFGDGTTASGATASHEYDVAGTYTVTLTVTDEDGETDTTSTELVVTDEALAAFDTFDRSSTGGWGSAGIGGAWSVTGGSTGVTSTADGAGVLTLPASSGRSMVLRDTEIRDSGSSIAYTLTGAPSTGALYVGIESRFDSSSIYRSTVWHRADGTVWLLVQRRGAVIASQPLTGRSWGAGDTFHLKTEVSGDGATTIRVKLWNDGAQEPTSWQLETTDGAATAESGAGSFGVYAYRSGGGSGQPPVRVEQISAQDLATPNGAELRSAPNQERTRDGNPASDSRDDATEERKSAPARGAESSGTEQSEPEQSDSEPTEPEPMQPEAEPSDAESTDPGESEPEQPEAEPSDAEPDATLTDRREAEEDAADGDGSSPTGEADPTVEEDDSTEDSASEREQDAEETPAQGAQDPDAETWADVTDDFERPDAATWGTTPNGAEWSPEGLRSTALGVEDGTGRIDLEPGDNGTVLADSVGRGDRDIEVGFRLEGDSDVTGTELGIIARGDDDGYRVSVRAEPDGSATLEAHAGTTLLDSRTVEGLRLEPGVDYTLRVSASGEDSTTLSATLWASGEDEPAQEQFAITDDSLDAQAEGRVGVLAGQSDDSSGAATVLIERFEAGAPA